MTNSVTKGSPGRILKSIQESKMSPVKQQVVRNSQQNPEFSNQNINGNMIPQIPAKYKSGKF